MSEYNQIDIRILPVYGQGGLARAFPNLTRLLRDHKYTIVLQEEPSLYHMVDVLSRIRKDPAVPDAAKRSLTIMEPQFVRLRDKARDQLLGRRLNELDKTLYALEDLFGELERALA